MHNTLKTVLGACALAAAVSFTATAEAQSGGLSIPVFKFSQERTALLVAGPESSSLSADGAAWGVVDRNFEPRETGANIDRLFVAATVLGIPIFVSPHYFIPRDQDLNFSATLETLTPKISPFDQYGYRPIDGFRRTGPNWLAQTRKSIENSGNDTASLHDVHWPQSTDLARQLSERGIEEVIIAGVFASRSTATRTRKLVEQGFRVLVVTDATAEGKQPGLGVYGTVFSNVANTGTIVRAMQTAAGM